MRRFLETIGQHNIAKMRYLSISLSDAIPTYSPELTGLQRRYLHDPVVYHMFKLLGSSGAVFDKLVIGFGGRAGVDWANQIFLRAFLSVRCHSLINTCAFQHSRISREVFGKMRDFMEVPLEANIDADKRKSPRMQHEANGYHICHHRHY